VQIHVSWLPGLGDDNASALRSIDLRCAIAVQRVAGHTIASLLQNTRARGAASSIFTAEPAIAMPTQWALVETGRANDW